MTHRQKGLIAVQQEELGAEAKVPTTRIDLGPFAQHCSFTLAADAIDSRFSQDAAEIESGKQERPRSRKKSSLSAGFRNRNKNSVRNLATERKYVSILRADLHRSSNLVTGLELEESIARLAPALEQMRRAVHQYGGIIHREMGDGLFAVFGAPVANDLHAVTACMAALELLRLIEALGDDEIRVRIGVHSGLVVAGPRQLDYTSMYDFDGPSLIVAERLQAAAEAGQALASEASRALSKDYIRFGNAEKHSMKGFPDPILVHPIHGIGELSKWRVTLGRRTAAFVGRGTQLSHLLALGEGSEAVGGHIAIVVGEPGVGKSRLVREAVQVFFQRGWQTIEAECSPIVGHSPFSLIKNIIANAISSLSEAERVKLKADLAPAQSAAISVLLEGAPTEAFPVWAQLSPRARGRTIVDMTCAVLTRHIELRPTIVLIEDLQWADEASAPAVEAIAALTKRLPVLILLTARTGDLPTWTMRLSAARLELSSLDRSAGMAMLDQLLGQSPRLQVLKGKLLDHTGAMPLFLEEVCRGLVEAGQLKGSWGEFEPAAQQAELGVPVTVQGVIAGRMDRLSPREKRLLQVAAAIGPQAPSRLLQAVSSLEESVFRQILTSLLAAGLLNWSPLEDEGTTSFPHECIRQVAYDTALESDRITLHKRILAELDAEAAGTGQDLSALMVHHAAQAKEWSRTAELATEIARKTFGQSAFSDAKRYFELAIASVDKLPPSSTRDATAIDLRIEARMAYGNIGQVSRWLKLAEDAEARALAIGDQMRRVPALAMRAAALNFCGTPSEAIEAGLSAVREAAAAGHSGWLAYAEYGLGQARFVAGQYNDAVDVLERAFRKFRFEGALPPPGGGAAQAALLSSMMICVCKAALGDEEGSAAAQDKAEEIAAENKTPPANIAAGFSRGVLLLSRGEIEHAEKSLTYSLKLARQHELHLFVPVLANQHGLALLQLSKPMAAREAFQSAYEEAELLGHRSASLRAQLGFTLCDLATGSQQHTAAEAITRCEQHARQGGYQPVELEALVIKAALFEHLGMDATHVRNAAWELTKSLAAIGTQRDVSRIVARLLRTPNLRKGGQN
ncbi:ATP-binding protein [Bradyrhizobium genosp. A]|uniref:ATP-binding protein n=1 Tax=Bradyrhizobium genosp. A TaxID=83626 RepID=UPI003CFA802C